jgi:co-chaperonin GroES (HSP10)
MLENSPPVPVTLDPLDDYVVIEPVDEETETRTGLIIPASAEAGCRSGIVTAVGAEAGGVEPGDKVLFPKDAGYDVRLAGTAVDRAARGARRRGVGILRRRRLAVQRSVGREAAGAVARVPVDLDGHGGREQAAVERQPDRARPDDALAWDVELELGGRRGLRRTRGDERRSADRGDRWTHTHQPTLAVAAKAGQGAPVHASRRGSRQPQIRGAAKLARGNSASARAKRGSRVRIPLPRLCG